MRKPTTKKQDLLRVFSIIMLAVLANTTVSLGRIAMDLPDEPIWFILISSSIVIIARYLEDEELLSKDVLYSAVRKHWLARGHDRCWENDAEVYRAAGLDPGTPLLPSKPEFLAACENYYEGQCRRRLGVDQRP